MEGLSESSHRPQRIVSTVIQFCNKQSEKELSILYLPSESSPNDNKDQKFKTNSFLHSSQLIHLPKIKTTCRLLSQRLGPAILIAKLAKTKRREREDKQTTTKVFIWTRLLFYWSLFHTGETIYPESRGGAEARTSSRWRCRLVSRGVAAKDYF